LNFEGRGGRDAAALFLVSGGEQRYGSVVRLDARSRIDKGG